jgi:D-glycero-alpha-D-manno-heptose 1-phosphate guanylyltransferase
MGAEDFHCDCVVLCGGLGKRLRALVTDNNKTMALVNKRPFLDLILAHIKQQGGQRVILCTGYKADKVEEYYRHNNQGLDIVFSREDEPLGTGGAIKKAVDLVHSDVFFAMNGDSHCPLNYAHMLADYKEKNAQALIAVSKVEDSNDYGGVAMAESRRIVRFEEKRKDRPAPYVNAGVYCLSRQIFEAVPMPERFSIEYDFFPKLIHHDFYGYIHQQSFWDIGTPERYQKALDELT